MRATRLIAASMSVHRRGCDLERVNDERIPYRNHHNKEKAAMIIDTKRAATIGLRATAAEREAWEIAARQDGRTLSAWIVRRCNGEPTTAPRQPAQPSFRAVDEVKSETTSTTMGGDACEATGPGEGQP